MVHEAHKSHTESHRISHTHDRSGPLPLACARAARNIQTRQEPLVAAHAARTDDRPAIVPFRRRTSVVMVAAEAARSLPQGGVY